MQQTRPYPLVVTAIALLSAVALLLTGSPPLRGQTQGEMNRTAGAEFKKADAAMNAAYKKLMGILDAPKKAQLRKAQTAWLAFRDAESAFRASKVQGGSVYPAIYATHRTALTQERTLALLHAYKLFTTDGEM